MINPTGKKLEKLLFGIFDHSIEGIDRYNHNGSLWLIFTDEMRWVVEYTKSQTLWYNYHFFKNEMEIIGLDCVENKDLIQKWFELRFLNINAVEDTIQNGVKHTVRVFDMSIKPVEDTIQNGVKHTLHETIPDSFLIEDTIQNGVKHTLHRHDFEIVEVEDTIQNGVKHCEDGDWLDGDERFEDIIQNGTK
jgi:hypothetical protein